VVVGVIFAMNAWRSSRWEEYGSGIVSCWERSVTSNWRASGDREDLVEGEQNGICSAIGMHPPGGFTPCFWYSFPSLPGFAPLRIAHADVLVLVVDGSDLVGAPASSS
jgi:hypothetical protein